MVLFIGCVFDIYGYLTAECEREIGDLKFSGMRDQGFSVSYPVVGPAEYQAEEVVGSVAPGGRIHWLGKPYRVVSGTGTLEVLDMLGSLSAGG